MYLDTVLDSLLHSCLGKKDVAKDCFIFVSSPKKNMPMAAVTKSILPCPGAPQFAVIALHLAWSSGCYIIPIDTESSDTSSSCQNFNHTCKWEKYSQIRPSAGHLACCLRLLRHRIPLLPSCKFHQTTVVQVKRAGDVNCQLSMLVLSAGDSGIHWWGKHILTFRSPGAALPLV